LGRGREHKKLEATLREILENGGESRLPKRSEGVRPLLARSLYYKRSYFGGSTFATLAIALSNFALLARFARFSR
jgi:hypothetical protein